MLELTSEETAACPRRLSLPHPVSSVFLFMVRFSEPSLNAQVSSTRSSLCLAHLHQQRCGLGIIIPRFEWNWTRATNIPRPHFCLCFFSPTLRRSPPIFLRANPGQPALRTSTDMIHVRRHCGIECASALRNARYEVHILPCLSSSIMLLHPATCFQERRLVLNSR